MASIWQPDIAVAEKVLRAVVVYLFMLAAFRFTGKRQVGQLTPFDLVLLLIISNVVQNAIIGPDNSLGGGLLGAVVILALNYAIVEVTYRSKRLRHLLEAQPTLLVHNGRILQSCRRGTRSRAHLARGFARSAPPQRRRRRRARAGRGARGQRRDQCHPTGGRRARRVSRQPLTLSDGAGRAA